MALLALLSQMSDPPTSGRLWWTVLVFLLWLVVLGGVVHLVVRILSARTARPVDHQEARSALEVVRERYSRGEIDRALYRGLLEDLDSSDADDDVDRVGGGDENED